MENLAKKTETIRPILEYGVIQNEGERTFTVQTSFGVVLSEQAIGCLVRPKTGDTVLLCMDEAERCFILSVLKREDACKTRTELSFLGSVDLRVKGGELSVSSEEKIAFASGKISMHADRGEAVIEKFSYTGSVLKSQVRRIVVVANTVENIFRRFTQRLQDSFRFIKDHDEVQSGNTRYLVEDTLTLHAKNANHMAEELVTINAEQIHLG
ncbi:MAG: DUF3540 domain-containing protein [Desulfobacteraceae bacterium]|nr:MAG: DUF3540 domain-containing protein [Desulfobacteraceae bacterium]